MKVEKIDHIHILVKDLERAMRFFSDILGTKFIGPIDRRPERPCRYAFDGLGLELVSPTSADDHWGPVMEKQGEGFLSLGLKVPDINEAVAELQAKGLKLEKRGERSGLKHAIFRPEEIHGVRIELVQYDPIQSVVIGNLEKTDELPWFKG